MLQGLLREKMLATEVTWVRGGRGGDQAEVKEGFLEEGEDESPGELGYAWGEADLRRGRGQDTYGKGGDEGQETGKGTKKLGASPDRKRKSNPEPKAEE